MKRLFTVLIIAIAAIAFFSCQKDNSLEKMRENELKRLDEFIQENYPNEEQLASGLYYIEELEGHGDSLIRPGDRVQIFYLTMDIDSMFIDESSGYREGHRFEPLEFTVGTGGVIGGLDEGITYMKEGGKSHLVIPSELAYGQSGQPTGGIGGFTTLLMEVEVYKVYPLRDPEADSESAE